MKKILIFSGQNDFENVKLSDLREADFAFICGQEIEIVKDRNEIPKRVSKNEVMYKISELMEPKEDGIAEFSRYSTTDRLLERFFPVIAKSEKK